MVAQTQKLIIMLIGKYSYCYKYIDSGNNTNVFVIDPVESTNKSINTYNQFINGLFTGNRYSITEIHYLMNNGFEWISC